MALTRPILASVGAFDATQAFTFTFSVIGGDSVVGNTLAIANQATGTTVYNQSVTATDYTHTLPANTLTNGTTYTAYVQTKNEAGELSLQSNVIQFNCYAAATLTFSNMPTSNIIPSAEFEFEATYSQAEGDGVSNYIFNLYDVQGVLVSTSNVLYLPSASAPPTTLSYTFSGFADNSRYLVECVVNAVSGQRVTTGRVEITVRYEAPIITGGITVSPNCQDGYMQGYIDWRQVPAGVDKLRIKRRRANEFNWTTIKEFDNRERQLAMIEKPQPGIEKFYDVDDEGVAIVKQTGISSRNAASTADDGETWTVGASFGSGSPDQIVGDYVANNGVGGYISKSGQKSIPLPVDIPSDLSITTYGNGDDVTLCAVMAPNSSNGIYWGGSEWKAHNHFPKIAHPCLYVWNRPYGGGQYMLCHDYETKKLYYISSNNIKANNVDWEEVTFGIGNTSTKPTLTEICSFYGYVYAYDANTRKIYFMNSGRWDETLTVPSSIGTVTGMAATMSINAADYVVTTHIITSSSGYYIVDKRGNITASNTSYGVAGRTTAYPSIVSAYARVQSADAKWYGITWIADRYTGNVCAFSHPQDENNVLHWAEPVEVNNLIDIVPAEDYIMRNSYCVATSSDDIVLTCALTIQSDETLSTGVVAAFDQFYYPGNYKGYINSQMPIIVNPYSADYWEDPYFIGGGIYAIAPMAELMSDQSSALRLKSIGEATSNSSIINIAGPNENNVLMATARDYINIKKDGDDTTMRFNGAWGKLATIGTVSEEDMTNIVLSQANNSSIAFIVRGLDEHTAVNPPVWAGPPTHIRPYTGEAIEPIYIVDTSLVNVGGDTSATNAGEYYVHFYLNDQSAYEWADGGFDAITLKWVISKLAVARPSMPTHNFTYTGNIIAPDLSYNSALSTATGDLSATNVGNYTIAVTLNDEANYRWSGSNDSTPYVFTWRIEPVRVTIPTLASSSFEYTGGVIAPTIDNLDADLVNVTGDAFAVNIGSYAVTFSLKDKANYTWTDGTTANKTATWKIAQIVAVPNLAATDYEYNPVAATSPVFTNVDTSIVTLSGDTSKNDVGTYSVTATLPNETLYAWSDGTTAPKSYAWNIKETAIMFYGSEDRNGISIKSAAKRWNGTVQLSDDGFTWYTWTPVKDSYSLFAHHVWLRGIGNSVIRTKLDVIATHAEDYTVECYGNIENLLDYATVANGEHPTMDNYCFAALFSDMDKLTMAPKLPATTLSNYCYSFMFYKTGITEAPELPAEVLAERCYQYMFQNCASLVNPPEMQITAAGRYCCYSMFSGCTSLTTAPNLSALNIDFGCYTSMFNKCSSLVSAPELPATELAERCYDAMFSGCAALATPPSLPATTLAQGCYSSMFQNCTSLATTPTLQATTLNISCYEAMFGGCSSLVNAPTLPATTLFDNCYASMFDRCSSLVSAPKLPATELAYGCYDNMFGDCSSLTSVPALPATTLKYYCYQYMFSGCKKIKVSTTQTDEYAIAYRIPKSGTGAPTNISASDYMFEDTGGTFTGTPIINTTYYLSNTNSVVE